MNFYFLFYFSPTDPLLFGPGYLKHETNPSCAIKDKFIKLYVSVFDNVQKQCNYKQFSRFLWIGICLFIRRELLTRVSVLESSSQLRPGTVCVCAKTSPSQYGNLLLGSESPRSRGSRFSDWPNLVKIGRVVFELCSGKFWKC